MAEQKGEGTRVSDDCSSPTRDCVAPDFLNLRERRTSIFLKPLLFKVFCCVLPNLLLTAAGGVLLLPMLQKTA